MRFSERIRTIARRSADGRVEHVCDDPGGTPVCRTVLRSVAAIPIGWLVVVGTYIVAMIAVAIFCSNPFRPGAQPSVGWLLVTLAVDIVCSILGGFTTGVVARRREIEHAAGLVLFTLLVSMCLSIGQKNPTPMPDWYTVAGYVLMVPSTLLGGWLRAKQGVLLTRIPRSMAQPMDDARLSIAITIDHSRPLIATLMAFVTFVAVLFGGMVLGGVGLIVALERLFGEDYHPRVMLPVFVASLILASILCRRVFRRIMPRDSSLLNDRRQE